MTVHRSSHHLIGGPPTCAAEPADTFGVDIAAASPAEGGGDARIPAGELGTHLHEPRSRPGVTSHPARLGRASAAAIAPSKVRSASVSSGRSICRRSTASWWRNTMISRSFQRPERTASRASDANNRYKIRYTRTQHRPASRQVNDHGRVSGTHRALRLVGRCPASGSTQSRLVPPAPSVLLQIGRWSCRVRVKPGRLPVPPSSRSQS